MIRRLVPTVLAFVAAAALSGPASAQSPDQRLAERYAPVVRLVDQPEPCKHGEPFEPIDVGLVLGNQSVALHGPWSESDVLKVAPTARDLSQGLFDYHLDFPGDALHPKCDYDKWERELVAGSKPRMYARVLSEPAHPGRLALQYWFFYVYNDWNDKHEGDWEMVQLDFRAGSPQEALSGRPNEVGYSQHEGAERADWGADKLELAGGTHPVVYPATGSHANYFSPNLYLGRSAKQGVGCDDTNGPSRDVRPELSLVPTAKADYVAAFPWLGFVGGWGEEHPQFYGGPTGPNTKTQWTEPLTWAEEWHDKAFAIPTGSLQHTTATDFFCGAVQKGSSVLTQLVANPTAVLLVLTLLVALAIWLCSRTRWNETAPYRVARRRPWGSIVTTAFRLYRQRPWLFLGLGLLFIPLDAVITILQYLLLNAGGLQSAGEHNGLIASAAFAIGLFSTIFGLNVVQAATSETVKELDAGREITARLAYRRTLKRAGPLLLSLSGASIVITVLSLTGAGFVVGAFLIVRWSLLPQAVMLRDHPSRPLRHSARTVRHHWWRTASLMLFVTVPALALGPLLGTLLLLFTSAPFSVINAVSGVAYMIMLPYAALVTTYLYYDLTVRRTLHDAQPATDEIVPAEI